MRMTHDDVTFHAFDWHFRHVGLLVLLCFTTSDPAFCQPLAA